MDDAFFPGFTSRHLSTGDTDIFARIGGSGPALLLLHGYPQTHVMWHLVAGELARHFTVVAADLRGYGQSSCPPTDIEHRPYSKRVMAQDMVEIMSKLGQTRFSVMGHDRGARVAYRMALEHADVVERLALLDIVSTVDQWQAENQQARMRMFHWGFLAQPAPLPESLIRRAPVDWVDGTFKRGTKAKSLGVIDPRALETYRRFFRDPDHVHATCEDFRAGATCDLLDDQADLAAGRCIDAPTLFLWSTHGSPSEFADPLGLWRRWCRHIEGGTIDSGHFIAEENPAALLAAAVPFLLGQSETRA
ncbi:MAG: alpha/beta fold hydrolase [Hyphomicrobiaceae bacterium]